MTRVLALGDSYTIGEGVAPSERWPERVMHGLHANAAGSIDLDIIARTGWTTAELDAAISERSPRAPFDLVTLLIGVNDEYRGHTLQAFVAGYITLLGRAVDLAGGRASRVLAISIPDWGVTPFATGRDRAAIAERIDAFNSAAHEQVRRVGAAWVDVTAISRDMGADPAALAADGLHPSGAAYRRWAERIAPAADAILRAA